MEDFKLNTDMIKELYCTPLSPHESYESFSLKEETLWDWFNTIHVEVGTHWIQRKLKEPGLSSFEQQILYSLQSEIHAIRGFTTPQKTEDIRSHLLYVIQAMESDMVDEEQFRKDFDAWLEEFKIDSIAHVIEQFYRALYNPENTVEQEAAQQQQTERWNRMQSPETEEPTKPHNTPF